MRLIGSTLSYLRERQSPVVMILHITIVCLVLSQLVFSEFMEISHNGEISRKMIEYYGTWFHIFIGLFLVFVTFWFVFVELKLYGLKHFFPYLYGAYSQIIQDIDQLKQIQLPEPDTSGLAATVQGLGIIALGLVLLSGVGWFLSWLIMAPWTDLLKEIHEALTGLMVAYVIGHGGMGILHLYIKLHQQKKSEERARR